MTATMRARLLGPTSGLIAAVLLLAVLAADLGLGATGWIVGLACAVVIAVALADALERDPGARLTPASWVTLARATLTVGAAALVADSFTRDVPVALLVTLATIALVLDLVDGQIARRTGTVTELGARFDGEVDAFLIAALSVYVAPELGAWVLAIGAAHYAFLAGQRLVPWMRAPLPQRRWRRVVAATQGVVLTVAAAGVLPRPVTQACMALALVLLAGSFGECVWWLWRHRDETRFPGLEAGVAQPRRGPVRTGIAVAFTVLAVLLVWAALVAPDHPSQVNAGAFARIPLELLFIVAVAAVLPPIPRRALAVLAGVLLGALALVRALNIGFYTAFDRPFKPLDDSSYVGITVETLRETIGTSSADLAVAIVVVIVLALLAIPVLAMLRTTQIAAGHRTWALGAAAALCVVWLALRAAGAPNASWSTAALVIDEVQSVQAALQDPAEFARQIANDPLRAAPREGPLADLRGNDVLLVFVESYGRVALEHPDIAPRVRAVLDRGEAQLRAQGYTSRSGWLKSPAFGGLSWLAHATLQSGVWVDGQRRYNQLVKKDRLTLTRAFGREGWRTVGFMPGNRRDWSVGRSYYRYNRVYDRRNLGYRGPDFGLAPMPDQYTLLTLQRRELARRPRPPLFAEVDLISSHAPWTRIPPLIPWETVGDGSIYRRLPVEESSESALFSDPEQARAAYTRSLEYSLTSFFAFVRRYGHDRMVVVLVGDHQPASVVSGHGASHDVPVSVIAPDSQVMGQITRWRWRAGIVPHARAPVWPMDRFRNRFLTAFSEDWRP